MRRMLWAALLAAPAALATATPAHAQGCATGNCGGGLPFGGPVMGGVVNAFRPGFQVPPFGCPSGFCFRLFPGLHQHGPLVNYGPYEGYYPFEPYGPWTSDLRYTGPTGPARRSEYGVATGWAPWLSNLFHRGYLRRGVGGGCGGSACGGGGLAIGGSIRGAGQYALTTLRNVAARLNPFHRFGCGGGCGG